MAGMQPFFVQKGQLCLALKPILPGWLFNEDGTVSFQFLGRTPVTYHNPSRRDSFDPQAVIRRISMQPNEGGTIELAGEIIPAPYARQVRDGKMGHIDVYFE